MEELSAEFKMKTYFPPPKYCTDNGAMIAWCGIERFQMNQSDDLSVMPKPIWPLE